MFIRAEENVRLPEVSVLQLHVLQNYFCKDCIYVLPGYVRVSVLDKCLSYGMSVLRCFTVSQTFVGIKFRGYKVLQIPMVKIKFRGVSLGTGQF